MLFLNVTCRLSEELLTLSADGQQVLLVFSQLCSKGTDNTEPRRKACEIIIIIILIVILSATVINIIILIIIVIFIISS